MKDVYIFIGWLVFILGVWMWSPEESHTCPSQPPHTRQTLKLYLATHGKVSDGHRLTAADSKLWDLCTAVCVPDQDYLDTMERGEE